MEALKNISLSIILASHTCKEDILPMLNRSDEKEKTDIHIHVFYEFIYFFMHMTLRMAFGNLTEEQIKKMQDSDHIFWNRCSSQLISIIRSLGSFKPVFLFLIILHFSIGAFINPLVTSDFERNLFYGRAFWKQIELTGNGFSVYDKTPLEIDQNYDIRDPLSGLLSYPNTTYDYPSLQLLFWAILAPLPFSSIIAKWVLSSFDLINFFLFLHKLIKV